MHRFSVCTFTQTMAIVIQKLDLACPFSQLSASSLEAHVVLLVPSPQCLVLPRLVSVHLGLAQGGSFLLDFVV
jgi:hypothetical protein